MFEQYCKICFISQLHDYWPELQVHVMFLVKLMCSTELFCIRMLFDLAVWAKCCCREYLSWGVIWVFFLQKRQQGSSKDNEHFVVNILWDRNGISIVIRRERKNSQLWLLWFKALSMPLHLQFPVQIHWQIAQRGCGVSLTGDIPDLSGHNPVPCALGWPCWRREVGPGDPLWSLPAWLILWFCDSEWI